MEAVLYLDALFRGATGRVIDCWTNRQVKSVGEARDLLYEQGLWIEARTVDYLVKKDIWMYAPCIEKKTMDIAAERRNALVERLVDEYRWGEGDWDFKPEEGGGAVFDALWSGLRHDFEAQFCRFYGIQGAEPFAESEREEMEMWLRTALQNAPEDAIEGLYGTSVIEEDA